MSAFLLPNNHINALVSFAKYRKNGRTFYTGQDRGYQLDDDSVFDKIAHALREANEESLLYRYGDRIKSEIDENQFVVDDVYVGNLSEADIISAVSCFHYQSCEHPLYKTTEAYFIVEAIKHIAVEALVDGVDKTWVIDDLEKPNRF